MTSMYSLCQQEDKVKAEREQKNEQLADYTATANEKNIIDVPGMTFTVYDCSEINTAEATEVGIEADF